MVSSVLMMPSSSTTLSQGHDVFLSFQGEDTRTGFTSHLYDALTRNDITTYKDDKSLEIGKIIAPELLQAIEASRIAIVVLSNSFATSKWCLEEIAKIVDCMERDKLTVIPVFYHVDPSDVRSQRNCFELGFSNHEIDPEIAPQKVETWRVAFKKVGSLSGLHVTEHRNEVEVISDIVKQILKATPETLPIDLPNGLVGIESRADEVKRMLRMESSEVLFIGICGMSGIGKTTLAEVVYKDIQNQFDKRCSFIENIKDISKQNHSTDLCKLQQKLLDDILKEKSIRVQNVKHGQTLLETKLRGLKVVIVLDDVNHRDQLSYLAGKREWFGHGTRIIVTSTNVDLLNSHKINEIHRCEEMKSNEALRLFCQSAFEQGHPTHGYEKLSDGIVKHAGGLPLALNVYGSMLCGKEESYWKETLRKLGEFSEQEVLERLGVVYARLDRNQSEAFKYIACFLKGRNTDFVKDILTNMGLYPEGAVTGLINKFLITINVEDSVWMHDLLQQMCWESLRSESRKYDGEHIAIKSRKDIEYVLSSKWKGTREIEIINQEPYKVGVDDWFGDPTCFSEMKKLKFLRISNIHFSEDLNYLSCDLRILEWHGCSLKSFPSSFQPKHIFELEMCYSQLQTLWEKDTDLPNLRSINLSFSKNLTKIPDLTSTSKLDKLILEGCTNLTELHESVFLQKRLRYVNLKGCTRLQNLGTHTIEMEALEALLLSGCSNLEYIPKFGQKMKRLEHLYVDGTSIKKLPYNLWQMCNLRKLDVSRTCIEELPSFIHTLGKLRLLSVNKCQLSFKYGGFLYTNLDRLLTDLRELDLSYCNLEAVPDGIGLLYHLVTLNLSGNEFVSLPASISVLSNLRMLYLNNCKRLKSLAKLSIVNEEALLGVSIRFNYYISRYGVDVSKFNATSNSNSPTVSCLNCPELAEDETGSYLTERILNSYLQLRTNYLNTPEAVFEIVGAGNIIPPGFKLLGSDDLILEDPWIGVAICAVVSVHHVDAYLDESKYVVTAHIHVGGKHWKISVPVKFLVAGLDNQLVFYWKVAADDLPRTVGLSKKHNCRFSFSVAPRDANLQVTTFGVRFIRNKEIQQLKVCEDSLSLAVSNVYKSILSFPTDVQNLVYNDNEDFVNDITGSIKKFILGNRNQQNSFDGIHKIITCLCEVNQNVLSECSDEWTNREFCLVYDYYGISHGTSQLFNEFVVLLKDVCNSWVSVKLALEQIMVNGRANDYTYWEETRQHLNDLEAAKNVRYSYSFVKSLADVCKQIVDFSAHLIKVMGGHMKLDSVKVLLRASSETIASIFSMVATFMYDSELLQEMKFLHGNDSWLCMIECFTKEGNERSSKREGYLKSSFDRELQVWDFDDNAILLQELKKKITCLSATKWIEEEMMMIEMDKLDKKIDRISKTIENMSSHAYKYSHNIRDAGESFIRFIADGNLQDRILFGVYIRPDDEDIRQLKQFGDDTRDAVTNLFRATAFLPAARHSDILVFKADNTNQIIKDIMKSIFEHTGQDRFYHILEIIKCLNLQVIEAGDLVNQIIDYIFLRIFPFQLKIIKRLLRFPRSFQDLLTRIYESWETVTLKLENILLKSKSGEYTYEEMLQLLDVKVVEHLNHIKKFSNHLRIYVVEQLPL